MNVPKILFSFVFLLMTVAAWGQAPVTRPPGSVPPASKEATGTAPSVKSPAAKSPVAKEEDKVELVNAETLEGGKFKGVEIRKLIGNVILKQKDTFLYCDSAYQYANRNMLEAFSNVRMVQGDTLTITGDAASYDGDKRLAKVRGNVFMKDPRMTLTTPSLDYDLEKKQAYYTEGGTIVEGENHLESRIGTYNTNAKLFTFQQQVKLTTPDNVITSANLQYNTENKIAYFQGPTTIKGKQGDLYAEDGQHNTLTKVSTFRKNAAVETPSYRLTGDQIYYDEAKQYGSAHQNVRMVSKKDDVVITGETAQYWRDKSLAKVYGSPVMHNVVSGDTLYVAADTLVSQEANAQHAQGMIHAYYGVKIYKSDLQGKCDSLTYNMADSAIYFHFTPTLWSSNSQLVADRIVMQLANNKLHKMFMYSNAFMISQDSIKNFNQIKGRDMVANFSENKIRRLNVNGNGESLYYALTEGDSTVMGMNKTLCSDMVLKFGVDDKLESISFLTNVDANFIPPHELKEEETKLKGFAWRITEKPTLKDVLAKRLPVPARVGPLPVSDKKDKPRPADRKKGLPPAQKQKPVATTKK
jgi:lipopolysaccharide export system protein LptA